MHFGHRLSSGIGRSLWKASAFGIILRGLQFPGNGQNPSGTMVAFRFTGSNMPDITPLTLIWRYRPFSQAGYYSIFWHSRQDGIFSADSTYFGVNPYPQSGSSSTDHNWCILSEEVTDIIDENGNDTTVIKNVWYTQAATAYPNASTSRIDFYWNLTAGANRLIRYDTNSALTNSPNSPGLIFGEGAWSPGIERINGILGAVKIFNARLSESDIISEAADMTQIVTSAGTTNRWWFKPTYESVDDLTDSVTGISAAWVNSNRATLVTI